MKDKSQKGFTIIEVALVLAIGALIFLVVFLAVPALQRNQRNDARKRDQSTVAEAITTFTSNNPGTQLTAAGFGSTSTNPYSGGNPNTSTPFGKYLDTLSTNTETVKIVSATTDIEGVRGSGDSEDSDDNAKRTLYIVVGTTCDTGSNTLKNGSQKQAAVVAYNETAQSLAPTCSPAN